MHQGEYSRIEQLTLVMKIPSIRIYVRASGTTIFDLGVRTYVRTYVRVAITIIFDQDYVTYHNFIMTDRIEVEY